MLVDVLRDKLPRLLSAGGEVGKRPGFLIQELQREANTLGSTSAALDLTNAQAKIDERNRAMRKVLAMPDGRARLQAIGYEPLPESTTAEVTRLTRQMSEPWAPVIKASGFKGD